MKINDKHIEATCDELLNNPSWRELVNSRHKIKGHGDKVFRAFELDCGSGYKITICMTEAIGFSMTSMKFTKPYIMPSFSTRFGTLSYRRTKLTDCKNREEFYLKLYNSLDGKIPLTECEAK